MYQASVQERIARQQAELQKYALGQSSDQMRLMMEENNYRRQLEQNNRSELRAERDYARGQYNEYKNQLKAEQEMMLERQIAADKAAAEQRSLALNEYLKNRDLAANERQTALAALKEAQAVAKGERDDDLKRYYGYQQKLQGERDFMLSQYNKMNERLVSERGVELARRGKIEGRLDNLQRSLDRTLTSLGDLPTLRQFTEADIAAEEQRRADRNVRDVDRAADRVASINEANLIRGGIDSGTAGAKKRAEITEQIADLYDRARQSARDDALRYITGAQGVLNTGFDKELGRREFALRETGNVASAGIDGLMNLPGLPSAVDYNFFNLPSAAFDRQIASANNYQAPLAVNSAIYDNLNVPVGMANTLNIPSRAQNAYAQLPSAIMGPTEMAFANPVQYMGIASEIGGNLLNNATTMANAAQNRADLAGYQFGRSFQNLISQAGGALDGWQASRAQQSSSPAPTYSPTNAQPTSYTTTGRNYYQPLNLNSYYQMPIGTSYYGGPR